MIRALVDRGRLVNGSIGVDEKVRAIGLGTCVAAQRGCCSIRIGLVHDDAGDRNAPLAPFNDLAASTADSRVNDHSGCVNLNCPCDLLEE